jgi:chromosome segregation ATPase
MDFDRITKLLELAGHPTTSDPEALNAVRAARKAISGGNGTFAELIRARPTISGMEAVLRTELEEEKRELAVVRAEAATLRADLGAARSEIPRLQKLLHESQKKAAHAKRRLRNVKAHLEETQQDLSKACVRVDLQERREKRVTDELAQKLKDKTQESDELYDRFSSSSAP